MTESENIKREIEWQEFLEMECLWQEFLKTDSGKRIVLFDPKLIQEFRAVWINGFGKGREFELRNWD